MAKKKQLPKAFEALLEQGDLAVLKAVFDKHELDARGGAFKQTALAFALCPDELARWLVANGADLHAGDSHGDTPLHSRARHWKGRIGVLLEIGADVNRGENARGTPLHAAAGACNAANAALLLQHGAHVDARTRDGVTPLAYALQRCSNAQLAGMAALADVLLSAGAQKTPEMREAVARIGANFEFHRAGFNKDAVEAASVALDKLYAFFGVPAAPRRVMHDGALPIVAKSLRWEDQHQELWEILVPSSGAASTVQGELIRISGRIHDELERNGGVNWDAEYNKMADAFVAHIASGTALDAAALADAHAIVSAAKRKNGDARRLCERAVQWVTLNPNPIPLPRPNYNR